MSQYAPVVPHGTGMADESHHDSPPDGHAPGRSDGRSAPAAPVPPSTDAGLVAG